MPHPGSEPEYEVVAIRYATRPARRAEHFLGGDPHDGPMAMDYFVWAITGHGKTVVVDCGFDAHVAARRGRSLLRCPVDALGLVGIEPRSVPDVVLTHLHYDHVGNLDRFPAARFHMQEPDIHYAVGRHMRHAHLRAPFEVEDVVRLVRLNHAGRVAMHTGVVTLHPGISLHPAPGHSPGLQFVRVNTARGAVVLASDVSHFYENIETDRPFPIAVDVPAMLDSFALVREAAASPAHIIPGHDPMVMARYESVSAALAGVAVMLHRPPQIEV